MFSNKLLRRGRRKRKHPHLRLPQGPLDLWGVSQNLIQQHLRHLLAIFFANLKTFKKGLFKTNRRVIVIVSLVIAAWSMVVLVWPNSSAAARSTLNLAKVATNTKMKSQVIGQEITTATLPFEIQNPLSQMAISQKFTNDHLAVDLDAEYEAQIRPLASGVVEKTGWDPYGKGKIVVINHGYNFKTLYAHLAKIEVQEGTVVTEDSAIGQVGTTGHSTGAHLHLEIFDTGKLVDPANFLPIPN